MPFDSHFKIAECETIIAYEFDDKALCTQALNTAADLRSVCVLDGYFKSMPKNDRLAIYGHSAVASYLCSLWTKRGLAKPKNLKTTDVSNLCTFPSPIAVPSSSTHDNELACEEDYDSEAPSSQAADYQYANHWADFKTLNPDHADMPAALIMFLVPLLTLQKVKKIILQSLKDEIEDYPESDYGLAMLGDDSYYKPDESEPAGTKGLFGTVIKIVQAAEKCHSRQYDENGWSNLVYTPLIAAALGNFNPERH
ncbi:hypothetical protein DER46DRAFT_650513 [Fusarium sp. MPI-SDFR-AT-0072]|nr:hypothetical protein DER46DRAFT_650513 [Fusarium sp. MPI-SDFR-AT-0072]